MNLLVSKLNCKLVAMTPLQRKICYVGGVALGGGAVSAIAHRASKIHPRSIRCYEELSCPGMLVAAHNQWYLHPLSLQIPFYGILACSASMQVYASGLAVITNIKKDYSTLNK